MSRHSDAKKARRKKRRDARDTRWVPDQVMDSILKAGEPAELAARDVVESVLGVDYAPDDEYPPDVVELVQAATVFDEWIAQRGWTFDTDFSLEGLASWIYPPSVTEFDDEAMEPATRVWFTTSGDEDDFPERVSFALVGAAGEDDIRRVGPDVLIEHIAAIETYRDGDAPPRVG